MKHPSLGVHIITRNRPEILKDCLESLVAQSVTPDDVLVVDNGPSFSTRVIVRQFQNRLPLRYITEKRIGIPYARNKGLVNIRTDILAFIDDDCVADRYWLENIYRHFNKVPDSVGVVGLSNCSDPHNVSESIEQMYYERWLLQHFPSLDKESRLQIGTVIDPKNVAFKSHILTSIRFSISAPFGDVGDEDVEFGNRLFQKDNNIFFDPSVIVTHHNSHTVKRLIYRNFWEGYSNHLLEKMGIDIRNTPHTVSLFRWIMLCITETRDMFSPLQLIQFWFLVFIYPLFSKAGRIYAKVSLKTDNRGKIPKRM